MSDEYIWVIDDDQSIRWVLEKTLKQAGMRVTTFESADEALELVRDNAIAPDAIISDIRMPGSDGLSLLKQLKNVYPNTPVLIMTAFSDLDSTVAAFEHGAFEYIPKPFDVDNVIDQVKRACHLQSDQAGNASNGFKKALLKDEEHAELLGDAPAMQDVFKAIGRLSRSKITVLINGESGTGKELIAQALHKHSPRSDKPFIALNMAAIPHADGGTLFLDEIGDMPATLQTRLLRVLADGQFYRVGGHTPIQVDVRIVAATHQNLESLVLEKRFREDLFHRLNVIRIEAPPLRARREDIPQLMRHFLKLAAMELKEETKTMSPAFESYITSLEWPGNVRQLQNTAHWLTVMASSQEITIEDMPAESHAVVSTDGNDWETGLRQWAIRALQEGETDLLGKATPTIERILIQCALNKTQDRRQEAARLIGWGRNTLTRKIKELEIS